MNPPPTIVRSRVRVYATVPAYYLGRPARLWIDGVRHRRLPGPSLVRPEQRTPA
jgi:hypothetical protein